MNTIISTLRKNTPLKYLDFTQVWDYYSIKSWSTLLANKNSNLHKLVLSLSCDNLENGISLHVGAKGWSQHSASEVIVFAGYVDDYNYSYFSKEELIELGLYNQ